MDKSLAIEGPSAGDITTSQFAGTTIADYTELVSKHFRQYPVLYVDLKVPSRTYRFNLKDVQGTTYEEMLILFDTIVLEVYAVYSDLLDGNFCKQLREPGALKRWRDFALNMITFELRNVFQKSVMVLIDEYDSPMHSAIEHGYVTLVRSAILLYSLFRAKYSVHCSRLANAIA